MVGRYYFYLPYVPPIQIVDPLCQRLVLLGVGHIPHFDHIPVLVLELNSLPAYGGKILPAKLSKLFGHVLVNLVGKVQHMIVFVLKLPHEV